MAAKKGRGTLFRANSWFFENTVSLSDEMIPRQMSEMDLTRIATRTSVSKSSLHEEHAHDEEESVLHSDDQDKTEAAPLNIPLAVSSSPLSSTRHLKKIFRRSRSDSCFDLNSTLKRVAFSDVTASPNMACNLLRRGRGSVSSICSLSSLTEDDVTETGKFRVTFFNKFGKKGSSAEGFKDASSVSHVFNGAVLVTDMIGSKIVLFGRSGRPEKTFITGEYTEPWSAVVTPKGHVAVTLRRRSCIAVWSWNGDSMAEFGHEHLQCPTGLAVDKDGRYIVTDEQTDKVYMFSPSRVLVTTVGEEAGVTFKQPRHVCFSTTGSIIVSDSGHHCVKVFDREGKYVTEFGEYGSCDGQFKFPYGICVDQDGNIIVCDHYNDRVSMFDSDGVFMQHLLTAKHGIKRPRGVAVRCGHNRKLYVTHGGLRATEVLVYRMVLNGTKIIVDFKSFV